MISVKKKHDLLSAECQHVLQFLVPLSYWSRDPEDGSLDFDTLSIMDGFDWILLISNDDRSKKCAWAIDKVNFSNCLINRSNVRKKFSVLQREPQWIIRQFCAVNDFSASNYQSSIYLTRSRSSKSTINSSFLQVFERIPRQLKLIGSCIKGPGVDLPWR